MTLESGGPIRQDEWAPTIPETLAALVTSRIRNNQNVMAAICGETGSGKSYSALAIGERCDPNFGIDNICFTIPEYLDALERSGPGDVLVFDESQAWGARRAMSKKNVAMSDIAAMCRFTLVSTIFTAPALSFIDVSLRRLMHLYGHVTALDRARAPPWQRNRTHIRIYQVSHPRFPGGGEAGAGIRYSYPYVPVERRGQRRTVCIETIWLPAPSSEILDAYERRKRESFEARLAAARQSVAGALPGGAAPPSPREDLVSRFNRQEVAE